MKIVVTSGGFDPLHSGHIAYLNEAAKLGDKLIVGLNSDAWLTRKKGRPFMDVATRTDILTHLDMVDFVYDFDDNDDSAVHLLEMVKEEMPDAEIIFANGGDRTEENIPEMAVEGITFKFGVGGENKENSSSWILENWANEKPANPEKSRPDHTQTRWGQYSIIRDGLENKIKELVVKPGGSLSYQKHSRRHELWLVTSGYGKVITNTDNFLIDHNDDKVSPLKKWDHLFVPKDSWHQLINDSKTEDLVLIEIQYGEQCIEEDIKSE